MYMQIIILYMLSTCNQLNSCVTMPRLCVVTLLLAPCSQAQSPSPSPSQQQQRPEEDAAPGEDKAPLLYPPAYKDQQSFYAVKL